MRQIEVVIGVVMLLGLSCVCLSCGSVILEPLQSDAPVRRQLSKSDLSQNCVNICGPGFHYDRPGGKLGGREQVCTRYPYDCGYACTTGWDFEYLKGGTEYTCQTAIQNPPQVVAPVQQMSEKEVRDQDCVNICGPGFHYDRPGDQLDGREQVCTRYPYDCGYACTTGWDFEYLKDGTEYTCQTAIQNPPQVVAPARQMNEKEARDQDCVSICGPGFHYDRPGGKLGGREQVCTRYPYDCGYACTTGWDFEYLKDGTEYTCQTAIQQP